MKIFDWWRNRLGEELIMEIITLVPEQQQEEIRLLPLPMTRAEMEAKQVSTPDEIGKEKK